MAKMMNIKI